MTDCPWWFEPDCEGKDCTECEFYEEDGLWEGEVAVEIEIIRYLSL